MHYMGPWTQCSMQPATIYTSCNSVIKPSNTLVSISSGCWLLIILYPLTIWYIKQQTKQKQISMIQVRQNFQALSTRLSPNSCMGGLATEYFNTQKLVCDCKFSHYLSYRRKFVCFTDLSHYLQSLHHLLVGCIGSDSEPFVEHLPLAVLNTVRVIHLNHVEVVFFDPQVQAQILPFHCFDQH